MKTFNLQIVTLDRKAFDGEAESISVRTTDGDVQILADHIDYLATINAGLVKITTPSGTRFAAASGGFISVTNGNVKLVSTTFEFSDEIDKDRALAAKEKAELALQQAVNEKEEKVAKMRLMRAAARVNASGK